MEEGTLKKILRDFPWLWAIKSELWHHWAVKIKICWPAPEDMHCAMNFSPDQSDAPKIWLKGKMKHLGGFTSENIVNITPRHGEYCISSIVDEYKKWHSYFVVEFCIMVVQEDKLTTTIVIYRPPKPQKNW